MSKRYVTTYEVHRVCGGAEEGGWYYTAYEYVDSTKFTNSNKAKKGLPKIKERFDSNPCCDYVHYLERKRDVGAKDSMDSPPPHYC